MSNQQIFPQAIYPIDGDVESQAGDPNVTVTGIQKTAVSDQQPLDGQILIFDESEQEYIPADPIVSGPDEVGTNPSVNPVQVGGQDEVDLVRELRTDTYGAIRSLRLEQLLYGVLLELRAIKALLIHLDLTARPQDYDADQFVQLGEI